MVGPRSAWGRAFTATLPDRRVNFLTEATSVRHPGAREDVGDLEVADAEYIDWLDQRVHAGIGLVPLPS